MAKNEEDVRATKAARTELTKRGIDVTLCDVRVMHGVLHIRGSVRKGPGGEFTDLKEELDRVCGLLRQKPGIKDVSLAVSIRT
jgi:hypothetical protein